MKQWAKERFAHSLVFQILLAANRLWRRTLDFLRHPRHYIQHRRKSKVLAGPGFLGLQGGLFNPGAVATDKGITVLAKGQFLHWMDAHGPEHLKFQKGPPVFLSLNEQLQISDQQRVSKLSGFPEEDNLELEDFRLFHFEQELWVNHYLIEVIRTPTETGYRGSRGCLSKFDPSAMELTYLGEPQLDIEIGRKEKNWVFLQKDGALYLFYSFHPFRVLKLVDRSSFRFSTVINSEVHPRLGDVGGYGTFVSYSTNPIPYDERSYFLLVHQCDPQGMGRLYHQWGVLLDRQSLLPVKITAEPICSGIGARGRLPGVLYVMSVVQRGDSFLFLNGEGDNFLTHITVPIAQLERLWIDIADCG